MIRKFGIAILLSLVAFSPDLSETEFISKDELYLKARYSASLKT
jgi:hypothetical protein